MQLNSAPVLQVITDVDRRGAQVAAMELQEALTERGRTVHTVALAPARMTARLDLPVLGPSRFAPKTLRDLRRQVRTAGAVVGCGSSTLPACALATVGSGVPFVYRSIGDLAYWANTPGRRVRVRFALRRAARVVALWQGAATALSERFGVPAERVRVIPNGVSAQRFAPVDTAARPAARRKLGLNPALPTLAVLGALSREKNVGAAIRILADLPDCQLVIAGDGQERSHLEALAETHAPGRVRFLGVVDEPADVFAAADLLVMPSRSEGMPAALIEAGFAGLPAVATDVGGVRDVVLSGQTGELVLPGDEMHLARAVCLALTNERTYGIAAREHCLANFEIGVVAAAWERLLDEVVAPGIPGG